VVVEVRDFGRRREPAANPNRGRGTAIMQAVGDSWERRTNGMGTTVVLRRELEPVPA
jgi:hypothetical protein